MMHARGHEVFHYGHERSVVSCTEHITVTNDAVLEKAYGNYDWRSQLFKHNTSDEAHVHFNREASEAIKARKQPGDFLLLFWSHGHVRAAVDHQRDMIIVEPGIGSFNNLVAPFAVFESYAVMHHIYAKYDKMPRFMDAVVPNYFDVNDFIDASELKWSSRGPSGGQFVGTEGRDAAVLALASAHDSIARLLKAPADAYALMICRMVPTKGLQVAVEACALAGLKLIVAGQGTLKDALGPAYASAKVTDLEDPTGITHVGYVEPRERAVLVARARCVMCPTLYNEPFGGINVEAQMSGVPAITTDWGAFTETVLHGVTGYRCRVMEHFVWAIKNCVHLDRRSIRSWAINNYGFDKVASMYEEYFKMLSTIRGGKGFYHEHPGRMGLKWLERAYPS